MRDETAFDRTSFVGLARAEPRDPYRLSLFARHLEPDEEPLILLPVHAGTLIVTDRRILEFRAHLDVHGAWNVRQFEGFHIHREWTPTDIHGIEHLTRPAGTTATGSHRYEETLVFSTEKGPAEVTISKAPEATLTPDEVQAVRAAVLGPHAK